MNRAFFFFTAALAVGVVGCSTPGLEIREVGAVHRDQSDGTTSGRVAIGLSQLARGNVGLALETFRRAAREDPQSYKALQGLAECYIQLGKPAVARRSLEQALALRPDVPELYRALAAVAQSEGKAQEAAALRREALARASVRQPAGPVAGPAPAPVLASVPPSAAATRPPQAVASRPPVVATHPTEPQAVATRPPEVVATRPAEPQTVTADFTLEPLSDKGPRLVRLSLGEVALMTRPGSPFAAAAARPQTDSTVHAPLRILNAARVQGIAARTRTLLASKGLRGADIGNAPGRNQHRELRYAKADVRRAQALAAKLPFKVLLVERDGPMTLLVGRNAAS